MRWWLLLAALLGVALMVVLSRGAAAEPPDARGEDGGFYVVPHHWIQDNPHYVIPWETKTHCCGPSHCKPAPAGAVVEEPGVGWRVIGAAVGSKQDQVFTFEQTYVNEHDALVWICVWSTGPKCLFTPFGG